jgi:hypothetical protein
MPLPFALVGFPIQLNAPSVRDAQVVRGWALEAEPGARLCEHIGQRQVKATATVNQGRVPLKEFAVTAPANAKRQAVATTQGLQEIAPLEGIIVDARAAPGIEHGRELVTVAR